MKLKIRLSDKVSNQGGRGFSGSQYRYWLDDMEVSDALTSLQLRMGVGDANAVKLTFLLDDVDVDAEALAQLTATVEGRETKVGFGCDELPEHVLSVLHEAYGDDVDLSKVGNWIYYGHPQDELVLRFEDGRSQMNLKLATLVEEMSGVNEQDKRGAISGS